ncbi:DUF547 domain-containing protein [Flavivirga rizhaonensis]|uniref:DUF547 domain-containing protein n=1 Tax=Flavivirga rizhaonensis TaxID=2559571 RepID=A0A4S1E0T4_9FLAO|nr:DUF547 domain-containing protein [Flavivirga rizhaonensis]TGV04120.1 DUF547 domain-containing protein [Flavivirga rizhaonensis]
MKYLIILLALITLSSCSGAKRITENMPIKDKQVDSVKTDEIIHQKTDTITLQKKKTEEEKKEDLEKIKSTKTFNHSTWNTLLQKHVSNKGHVNYKTFKSDRNELVNYITYLGKQTPQDSWAKEAKLAYWINAYNAMTIDLILRYYPVKSIKDIKKPWEQRFWKLGEKWYNLNEIEHQILRKMGEPRIHFAIVCASFSCPKLQNNAYTASSINKQLTNATKEFLNDPERNTISENTLGLSKIFQWFAKDFKQTGTLTDFLNQYSDITISDKAKKNFKDYNWDLNE